MRLTIAIIMLFAFANTADQIPHLESFDVQRYLGTWYEAARSKNIIFERGEHVHAEYSDRGNGTINVFNTGRLEDGKENSIKGHAEPDGSGIPGRLSLVFDNWFGRFIKGKYWVLDTDYESYSLVYGPSKLIFDNSSAYILTRDQQVSPEFLADLVDKLEGLVGIGEDKLHFTIQN